MTSARCPAAAVVALWAASAAAGCVLPTGHVDLDAPFLCPSAGPVASRCEGGARVSIEAGARGALGAVNAVMTVTAYRGDGSVAATWQGSARWEGPLPASGAFAGAVERGRVTWDGASARDVRVETGGEGADDHRARRGGEAR